MHETGEKDEPVISLHYFFGAVDFYVLEFNGDDTFSVIYLQMENTKNQKSTIKAEPPYSKPSLC
jgi:hypothetical protein